MFRYLAGVLICSIISLVQLSGQVKMDFIIQDADHLIPLPDPGPFLR